MVVTEDAWDAAAARRLATALGWRAPDGGSGTADDEVAGAITSRAIAGAARR